MSLIRLLFLPVLLLTVINSPSVAQYDRQVVGFIYHRFGDDRYPSTNTPLADFSDHLAFLKNNGYKVMNFTEAVHYLQQEGVYEKAAVITIDDGFKSFYESALPLLRQYGYPSTLFINTGSIGGRDYMSWKNIKESIEAGVEIGNHSHSHGYFLNVGEQNRIDTFRAELRIAQQLIEENLGVIPKVFAYPYGEFSPEMAAAVEKEGFIAAAAQNSGVMYSKGDFFAFPRFPMSTAYSSSEKFADKARMKALEVAHIKPESFLISSDISQPQLRLTFLKENLYLDDLQCFIQGGESVMETKENGDFIEVTVSPKTPLKARRTLYTLTIKDTSNTWHWYSHLWINPDRR